MDKIYFKFSKFRKAITIGIDINDRDFIDMVREIEIPLLPNLLVLIRGSFLGGIFDPVRYFLAEQLVFFDGNEKLAVLGCTCGEVECWPLMACIIRGRIPGMARANRIKLFKGHYEVTI
jgi:hypothetical protein